MSDALTVQFKPHTVGSKVEESVTKRLLSLFQHVSVLNGTRFIGTLKMDHPAKEPNLVIGRPDMNSIRIKVPLPNKPSARGEYDTYVVDLKPAESGADLNGICAAMHEAQRNSKSAEITVDSAPVVQPAQQGRKVLAQVLLAIHQLNTIAVHPQPAVKIVADVTRDNRSQPAIRKRVREMEQGGFIVPAGKQGLIITYRLTAKAVDLIKEKLGTIVDVQATQPVSAPPEKLPEPEFTFDDAMAALQKKLDELRTLMVGAEALRQEVKSDEAALREKKDRLARMESAERELRNLAKRLSGLAA